MEDKYDKYVLSRCVMRCRLMHGWVKKAHEYRTRMVRVLAMPNDPSKQPRMCAFKADAVISVSHATAEWQGGKSNNGNVTTLPPAPMTVTSVVLVNGAIWSPEPFDQVMAKIEGTWEESRTKEATNDRT